ncbi:Dothistromin biosynthesis peroxidase dotB [Pseudocercospora fuligena]|uniref:Dothistromin biosynthesis peroxidase dotB n=1 Tax=Pseudocercospora fuligena TaxID=685502 RepID=A0A8H6VLW7_9PEZI|nr:Dothistromin biosynthesis peroxidase dotB [Pseudocercospora fuligena]
MYTTRLSSLASLLGLLCCSALAISSPHHGAHQHIRHPEKRLLVNTFKEPISVTGDHAFQPPGEGDQRGPCMVTDMHLDLIPVLTVFFLRSWAECSRKPCMATKRHLYLNLMLTFSSGQGYIPRDGVVSFLGAITAMNEVYGVSLELGTILAVMGVVWTGNPVSLNPSFSIGGNDTEVQNLLGNLLGVLGSPRGLDHSHNFIEADSSPTRDDLYVTGNPVTMNLTKFETLYDMVAEDSNQTFTLDVMSDFAEVRWKETISTNPYFYYGPVTGMLARNTGFCFIGNLFANYSAENPSGALTHDILKNFFGVSGDRSNFTYQIGHERIPENWYKTTVDYGLVQLNLDVVYFVTRYPHFASVGGNVGKVNSFTGVDLADPAGGVLNGLDLLKSNNLLCFVLEVVNFAAPNYLNDLVSTLAEPLKILTDAIAAPLLNMSCPQLDEITRDGVPLWESLGAQFPGANRSGSAL